MFNVKDGFDVVIGNPPYIGESGRKELFRKTKEGNLEKFYLGKMDYFYFFFHLALNIVRPYGDVAFITTNYFRTATGARKLRADLKQRAMIRRLIDFNELHFFESALGQHNMITMLRKDVGNDIVHTCITDRNGFVNPQVLTRILCAEDEDTQYYEVAQEELYDGSENYIRLNRNCVIAGVRKLTINTILDKVASQGVGLGQITNINQGVGSGCDYVSPRNERRLPANSEAKHGDGIFVLNLDNPRDRRAVASFTNSEKQLLREFYKNSDICRFVCGTKTTKRLLYIGRELDDLSAFPNVVEHLNRFGAILAERREVKNGVIRLFQLQWPRTETIFTGEKIVVPYRSIENAFAYNKAEWFCGSDCYVITQKETDYSLVFLLALLNSRLYYQWLFHRGKRKGGMLEMFQVPLSEVPIKRIPREDQKAFSKLAEEIITAKRKDMNADTSKLESDIDELVFDLYGLTPEEIAIVEDLFKKK